MSQFSFYAAATFYFCDGQWQRTQFVYTSTARMVWGMGSSRARQCLFGKRHQCQKPECIGCWSHPRKYDHIHQWTNPWRERLGHQSSPIQSDLFWRHKHTAFLGCLWLQWVVCFRFVRSKYPWWTLHQCGLCSDPQVVEAVWHCSPAIVPYCYQRHSLSTTEYLPTLWPGIRVRAT